MSPDANIQQVAEAIRAACVESAQTAGERAMFDGLCVEGIVEAMCDAIRSVDIAAIIPTTSANTPTTR